MKKRLLSVALCLCMVLTLLPTAALAADEPNFTDAVVGQTTFTFDTVPYIYQGDGSGGICLATYNVPSYKYDPLIGNLIWKAKDGYLLYSYNSGDGTADVTLHNVTIQNTKEPVQAKVSLEHCGIGLPNLDFNFVVEGTNVITSTNLNAIGYSCKQISLSGNGTLTVNENNGTGIDCDNLIKAPGVTLSGLVRTRESTSFYTFYGSMTVASRTNAERVTTITAGATVTVPANTTLDLTRVTSLNIAEDGELINNGTLAFFKQGHTPAHLFTIDEIKELNITGPGKVILSDGEYVKTNDQWVREVEYTSDLAENVLDFSEAEDIPTENTTYTAGDGTVVWTPTLEGESVTGGTLTMTDATVEAMDLTSLDAVTIEVEGSNDISEYGNLRAKGLTLTGSGTLTAPGYVDWDEDFGGSVVGIVLDGYGDYPTFTNDIGNRLNAIVSKDYDDPEDDSITTYTVCGTTYMAGELIVSSSDTFIIGPGATLTVSAGGTLNLQGAWENVALQGTLVNNGTVVLPEDVDASVITGLGLSGSGVVETFDGDLYTNAGTQMHSSNSELDLTKLDSDEGNLENSGWEWNYESKTLTIENLVLLTSGCDAITLPADAKLVVQGTNRVSISSGGLSAPNYNGLSAEGDLTVSGAGTLTASGSYSPLTGTESAFSIAGKLTLNSGNLIGAGQNGIDRIEVSGGELNGGSIQTSTLRSYLEQEPQDLVINGGTVTAAIFVDGSDLIITGGTVNAERTMGSFYGGLEVSSGNLIVSGGTVTAEDSYGAIWASSVSPQSLTPQSAPELGQIILTGMKAVTTPAGGKVVSDGKNSTFCVGNQLNWDDEEKEYTNICTKVVLTKSTGGSTGGSGSSGGGSTGGGSTNTGTATNPDGSTTTTVTNPTTGATTETTKGKDGSVTITETKKDGTATTTDKAANGVTAVTKTDANGLPTSVAVTVPPAVTGGADVNVPAALGKSEGTVKVELTLADGTKKTAVGQYADGKINVAVPATANLAVSTTVVPPVAETFTDVPANAWYGSDLQTLVTLGLMNGKTANSFGANEKMNRQQMCMVLARAAGEAPANMAEALRWAKENGISDGTNPTGTVSRQQFVALLWRASGSPASTMDMSGYPDFDKAASYAKEAFRWAVETGVVNGSSDGSLNVEAATNRAQIAAMISRNLSK